MKTVRETNLVSLAAPFAMECLPPTPPAPQTNQTCRAPVALPRVTGNATAVATAPTAPTAATSCTTKQPTLQTTVEQACIKPPTSRFFLRTPSLPSLEKRKAKQKREKKLLQHAH